AAFHCVHACLQRAMRRSVRGHTSKSKKFLGNFAAKCGESINSFRHSRAHCPAHTSVYQRPSVLRKWFVAFVEGSSSRPLGHSRKCHAKHGSDGKRSVVSSQRLEPGGMRCR